MLHRGVKAVLFHVRQYKNLYSVDCMPCKFEEVAICMFLSRSCDSIFDSVSVCVCITFTMCMHCKRVQCVVQNLLLLKKKVVHSVVYKTVINERCMGIRCIKTARNQVYVVYRNYSKQLKQIEVLEEVLSIT